MTDKKKHDHEEEMNEKQTEAVAMSENMEQLSSEIEALKRQVEESQAKLAETVQGWQRATADFQNYKKRIERDNELNYASMKGEIIKKVLPALDDLERALQNRPADDAWANGIELIARKLQNLLNSEGLKRIEAEGIPFDPNFHEAISHEHNEDFESGQVIAVVQNGYMLGERVIRPALVRVAQ
ncbi:MAG TPA: nucleotide exchange factor GrpE [Anaerolineales bacterium]|nr:nucleotide exchange factor GrpE [Anaerolineales bacterium]